jgi:hypothetical protein
MIQALSLWTDLEDAYRGTHGFGSNVAEIYVYRCMPQSSLVANNLGKDNLTGLAREVVGEAVRDANESLHNLLAHFAKERKARIEIELGPHRFREVGEWLKASGQDHRWHVRVTPIK